MPQPKPEAAPSQEFSQQADDDWEEVHTPPTSDEGEETLSIVSDGSLGEPSTTNDFVEVDDPKRTAYPGRIYQDPVKYEPIGPLPTLRRVLYDLKDTLKDSIAGLEEFNQNASMLAISLSGSIWQAQQRQYDTLNILLTNHDSSDWEAYAKDGGLSFDEFAELDARAADKLCKILKTFVIEVQERVRFWKGRDGGGAMGVEDENEDVGWLDFVFPVVDEVSMMLRVPPLEEHDWHEKPKAKGKETAPEEADATAGAAAAGDSTQSQQGQGHDAKVHERMAMVSDW